VPTREDLQGPGQPTRLGRAIRRLHDGPRFRGDVSMLRLAEAYVAAAEARAIPLYPDVAPRRAALRRIECALEARPWPTAPCHNDLLPENWIDDGRRLWIVDYEYSGNNDPAFELGNLCQELLYDDARLAELCLAYFGTVSPGRLARIRLHTIVSDVGWALWAALQAAISQIPFDFRRYGSERWARAVAKLDAPEFGAWLDALEHRD
jgi:thiamine kinase-like enzyme